MSTSSFRAGWDILSIVGGCVPSENNGYAGMSCQLTLHFSRNFLKVSFLVFGVLSLTSILTTLLSENEKKLLFVVLAQPGSLAASHPGKVTVVHLPLADLASRPPSLPSRMWLHSGPVLASKNNLTILKSPPLELFFFTAFLNE